jgi:hypothetical protein
MENTLSNYSEKIQRLKSGLFKVADFESTPELVLTIGYLVEDQQVGEQFKDVLYFEDDGRKLALNVTNAETLIELLGDEPAAWPGHKIKLFLGSYKEGRTGEMKPAVRVKAPTDESSKPTGGNGATKETAPTVQPPAPLNDMNDDIPF